MIKYSPSVSVLRQIRRELNRIIPKAKVRFASKRTLKIDHAY